jgi:type IV pilus assembly protein PilC
MISAGVPMLRALTTLEEQTDSKGLKKALKKITSDVEAGTSLSDALEKHPKVFSNVYVNMVRAGETGGILDQIMMRLANQVEKDSEIRGKFKSAMIYPSSCVTSCYWRSWVLDGRRVVPKLASILEGAGGQLPIQTKIILAMSKFISHQWYIILIATFMAIFAFKKFTSKPAGRYKFDKLMLKIPIFGNIIMKVNVARFARTFSSLLSAGVTVIDAHRCH